MTLSNLSRRQFIVGTASTGLSLGVIAACAPAKAPKAIDGPPLPEVNAWVQIGRDNSVNVRIARSEMGQGTSTGLAQLVAEELGCDWKDVKVEYPTPGENLARERVWGSFSTGGSQGLRGSHQYVREGGAAARIMLVEAAASLWEADPSECRVENGVISLNGTRKSVSFGEVAEAAAKLTPPLEVTLKDPKDWSIIGAPKKRLDTAKKITGELKYGADLSMPNLLNASIKQCPVMGGTVKSFNADEAMTKPGVKKVVQIGDNAVAVIAKTWWQAHSALEAMEVEWDKGINANFSTADIEALLEDGLSATKTGTGNRGGDVDSAMKNAAKTIEAIYNYPSLNHAPMEPMEMPGTPIKLLWSREEDQMHGFYHPVTKCKLQGGIDEDGKLVALDFKISGQSILAALAPQALANGIDYATFQGLLPAGVDSRVEDQAMQYSFPNFHIHHAMRNPPIRPGFWRGVNANPNAIYMECFMDEMAEAAGRDALDFRLDLLKESPKMAAVLKAAAEKGGWGRNDGKARGISNIYCFGSYVAACAEVTVSDDGALKIDKITAATDCGYAVNPQQIEAQVQGSFVYGLSAMLYGDITYKDGEVQETNFDTYNSMRIAEMPEVETIIMPSGGFWGGVGEPTIAVAAPAVMNAIYNATGKRVRKLPIKDHDGDSVMHRYARGLSQSDIEQIAAYLGD